MAKRTDIKKILVLGSGPIVIGQACEFDYSGTQALKALKQEGFYIILVNSNPATIMTDPEFSDRTYIEPLTVETIEKVIIKERPDAILPTLGGQTALNLAVLLQEKGILDKYGVKFIGADYAAIRKAEDRKLFKQAVISAGLSNPESGYARTLREAEKIAQKIGFPNIIRPSFTLGGSGGNICHSREEFADKVKNGLALSPAGSVLIEESLIGWKEFELEVMRDKNDNVVIVCSIENLDPMGVHTGDSITVAPAQTLTDREYQYLRDASIKIIREIGVDTGGSNIQFAVNPETGRVLVIEMNPRVSRSSALASKATGFPIARIAALLAVGYTLDEIQNEITRKTMAAFEPALDYVVVKIPRFTFEKFQAADQTLGVSMKSVGEVMAIGRNFREALQKAVRGLEIGRAGLGSDGKGQVPVVEKMALQPESSIEKRAYLELLKYKLKVPNCDRIFNIRYALTLGLSVREISDLSGIDRWFVAQIAELNEIEKEIKSSGLTFDTVLEAKKNGFSDCQLAYLSGRTENEIRSLRKKLGIRPCYKLVDTCAGEFEAYTPYFYSTYEQESDIVHSSQSIAHSNKKIMILGGGPNRIGQGIEFDYCCVRALFALRKKGFTTIMVNCNPETVSTDYDISDRLYFEPLTFEDVMNIAEREKPYGVIVQLGGQTPLNLTKKLAAAGVRILGSSADSIDLAEDRVRFGRILKKAGIPHAEWGMAENLKEAVNIAEKIGYPVLVRPSYVLGGRAMEIVYDDHSMEKYIQAAVSVSIDHPVFIDKFLVRAREVDVDAVSDGKNVHIAGIMEHIEEAGIHSGDSACILPPATLKRKTINKIVDYTVCLARMLSVKGLLNIQFAIRDDRVYVIEANPRASRTVPFVSKATGMPVLDMAVSAMLGEKIFPNSFSAAFSYYAVKESVLPFSRFAGSDAVLGPEMKSTGEVMGIDRSVHQAFAKSQAAAGFSIPSKGGVFISAQKKDLQALNKKIRQLSSMGFKLYATSGTAEFLSGKGISVKVVKKVSEGTPSIIDLIKKMAASGSPFLIINIPGFKKSSTNDGYLIRTEAIKNGIPIITTVSAACAVTEAIKSMKKQPFSVKPLQDYYKN